MMPAIEARIRNYDPQLVAVMLFSHSPWYKNPI
jgi:hypothetical protein